MSPGDRVEPTPFPAPGSKPARSRSGPPGPGGGPPTPLRRAPERRGPGLRSVVMALGLLVGVNLLVVAFFLIGRGDDDAPPLPAEIELVIPTRSAVIRPMEDIGADLLDDHTGVLLLDGAEIPEDQLKRIAPLGQVVFRPGPGMDLEKLAPGFHTATVIYWRQDLSRDQSRSYTWSFQVG